MFLQVLIFAILLAIEVFLGIYSKLIGRNISKKYHYILSSQIEPIKILEIYREKFNKLDLKASPKLHGIVYSGDEFVVVNSKQMYAKDLFTNYFILLNLELSKKENTFLRDIATYQTILFIFQFLFLGVSLFIKTEYTEILFLIPIVIEVVLFLLTIFGYILYDIALSEVDDIAAELLDLDEIEVIRAERLKNDLKFKVFEYPISILSNLLNFLRP